MWSIINEYFYYNCPFLAPPSPPQNLRTPDISSRSVTLQWQVPQGNGGSEITGYIVEKKSSTSKSWSKVVTLDANCLTYTVDNLKDKCEYSFRVSAENSVGVSVPAEINNVALKKFASKCSEKITVKLTTIMTPSTPPV